MLHYDSKELQSLIAAFKSADETVKSVVLKTRADNIEEYKLKVDKKLDEINAKLTKKSISWARSDMPKAYKEGEKNIDGEISHKTSLDEDDIVGGYIQLAKNVQHAVDERKEAIRSAIEKAEKENSFGATVGIVKKIIEEELAKDNAAMVIVYNNGAKMPLPAHAEMLARTSRIIASNTGCFDRCKELGLDLVECNIVPNSCPYCKKYEGKVYSISGKDKRFPALYETALQKGYNIMHPNCRHEFLPFQESFVSSPEELEKVIERSNHFEELDKNDKLFKIYNKEQAFQRQLVKERRMFLDAKSLYAQDMPYQTIGGFRKASRQYYAARKLGDGSEKKLPFHALHERNNDNNQYNRWIEIIGEENMPKTLAEFQEIKYNDIEHYEQLRAYKNSINSGLLSPLVDFKLYHKENKRFDQEVVGMTTTNGITIKSISRHFYERYFGSIEDRRDGVPFETIKDCIIKGVPQDVKTDKKGRASQVFTIEGVAQVSVNPNTGELIQVNPFKRRIKKEQNG